MKKSICLYILVALALAIVAADVEFGAATPTPREAAGVPVPADLPRLVPSVNGETAAGRLFIGTNTGPPYLLIFDTLSAWLRDAGLSLKVIGVCSLATLSFSLKFLWAPLVDRTRIPVLTKLDGHRRSWMIDTQGLIIIGLWLIAGTNPASALTVMAVLAVMMGFASAT